MDDYQMKTGESVTQEKHTKSKNKKTTDNRKPKLKGIILKLVPFYVIQKKKKQAKD